MRAGQVMLDGLEAADRHAELGADFHVLDRQIEHLPGEPEQHRRRRHRPAFLGERDGLNDLLTFGHEVGWAGLIANREQVSGPVDRALTDEPQRGGRGREQRVSAGDQHHLGDVGVDRERGIRQHDRQGRFTRRHARQPSIDARVAGERCQ